MKRYISLLVVIFLLSVSNSLSAQKVFKILAIGNSFSQDAVEQNLYQLAKAEGYQVIIGNMMIGGCTLQRHLNNAVNDTAVYSYRKININGKKVVEENVSLKTALKDEDWDYVSLQQASALSGMYNTYEVSLPDLVKYVRQYLSQDTKLILHQTWAYAANSTHRAFKNYKHDQMNMYVAIMTAVKKAVDLVKFDILIPSGTAIQNARTSFVGDNWNRDGFHLAPKGRYVAACTWFESVFGHNVVGNSYCPKNMSAEECKVAQIAAHQAVLHPYEVTNIGD